MSISWITQAGSSGSVEHVNFRAQHPPARRSTRFRTFKDLKEGLPTFEDVRAFIRERKNHRENATDKPPKTYISIPAASSSTPTAYGLPHHMHGRSSHPIQISNISLIHTGHSQAHTHTRESYMQQGMGQVPNFYRGIPLPPQPSQSILSKVGSGPMQQDTWVGRDKGSFPEAIASWRMRQTLSQTNDTRFPNVASEDLLPPSIAMSRRPLAHSAFSPACRVSSATSPVSLPTLSTAVQMRGPLNGRSATSDKTTQQGDISMTIEDVLSRVTPQSSSVIQASEIGRAHV